MNRIIDSFPLQRNVQNIANGLGTKKGEASLRWMLVALFAIVFIFSAPAIANSAYQKQVTTTALLFSVVKKGSHTIPFNKVISTAVLVSFFCFYKWEASISLLHYAIAVKSQLVHSAVEFLSIKQICTLSKVACLTYNTDEYLYLS